MKKHLGHFFIWLTILLGGLFFLLSIEFHMPVWLTRILDARLKQYSLQVSYSAAYFDLAGNVRLQGVQGRWRGLLEFSSRAALLKPFSAQGAQLVIDGGRLHTGFLQLPLPETIELNGSIQLRRRGVYFQSLRLRSGSLSAVVRGFLPTSSSGAATVSIGTGSSDKLLAQLLSQLCGDTNLWAAQLQLGAQGTRLQLAGQQLSLGDYQLRAPVLTLNYPFSSFWLEADSFSSPFFSANKISASYNAEEGALWRVLAHQGSIASKISTQNISASGRWPIISLADPSAAAGLSAVVQLGNESFVSLSQVSLQPLSAQLRGNIPARVFQQAGFRMLTQQPVYAYARASAQDGLLFSAYAQKGTVYDLAFNSFSARGRLTRTEAVADSFSATLPSGIASGSVAFRFADKSTRYTVVSQASPTALPWLGSWWNLAFEPFGSSFTPLVMATVDMQPSRLVRALGVASAQDHPYRTLRLNETFATFDARPDNAEVFFYTAANTQWINGQINWSPAFTLKAYGQATPATLARTYLEEIPPSLDELEFSIPPNVIGTANENGFHLDLASADLIKFHSLEFQGANVTANGDLLGVTLSPVSFGFAQGQGTATAQIGADGVGQASFSVRNADLGQWSLLGPLTDMLKDSWFSFATLRLHSADGEMSFDPLRINVPRLNMWGDQHAATATGSIDPVAQTIDFKVKLKTLGGEKPTLKLIAPIVRPFTSVIETRVRGPIEKPVWKMQLSNPF